MYFSLFLGSYFLIFLHSCQEGPGVNGIVNITIKTETCNGCAGSDPQGFIEGGVQLYLKVTLFFGLFRPGDFYGPTNWQYSQTLYLKYNLMIKLLIYCQQHIK